MGSTDKKCLTSCWLLWYIINTKYMRELQHRERLRKQSWDVNMGGDENAKTSQES